MSLYIAVDAEGCYDHVPAELSDIVRELEEHHGAEKMEAYETVDAGVFAVDVSEPGTYLVVRVSDD